jgi:hypothetical protein
MLLVYICISHHIVLLRGAVQYNSAAFRRYLAEVIRHSHLQGITRRACRSFRQDVFLSTSRRSDFLSLRCKRVGDKNRMTTKETYPWSWNVASATASVLPTASKQYRTAVMEAKDSTVVMLRIYLVTPILSRRKVPMGAIKNVRFTIDIHLSRGGAIRFGGLIFRSSPRSRLRTHRVYPLQATGGRNRWRTSDRRSKRRSF